MAEVSDRSIKISVLDGVALTLLLLAMSWGTDCMRAQRTKEPHSLGVAIACRIGGPTLCPKEAP